MTRKLPGWSSRYIEQKDRVIELASNQCVPTSYKIQSMHTKWWQRDSNNTVATTKTLFCEREREHDEVYAASGLQFRPRRIINNFKIYAGEI